MGVGCGGERHAVGVFRRVLLTCDLARNGRKIDRALELRLSELTDEYANPDLGALGAKIESEG